MSIAEKLTTIAENERRVFHSGYDKGKQTEHNNFEDMYHDFGNRTVYTYAYAYVWDDVGFKPEYDINAKYAAGMFRQSKITDLKGILERLGKKLVITHEQVDYFAALSTITRFPELGTAFIGLNNAFNGAAGLFHIDKLNMSTWTECSCSRTFSGCGNLQYIRFNKGIRPVNLSFADCPLMSKESFASNNVDGNGYGLIPALSDKDGGTITVSNTAVKAAFPNNNEWIALCNTKKNWTITRA